MMRSRCNDDAFTLFNELLSSGISQREFHSILIRSNRSKVDARMIVANEKSSFSWIKRCDSTMTSKLHARRIQPIQDNERSRRLHCALCIMHTTEQTIGLCDGRRVLFFNELFSLVDDKCAMNACTASSILGMSFGLRLRFVERRNDFVSHDEWKIAE